MPTTRTDPPTAGGAAGRGFDGWKLGTPPPRAPIGRTRYALPLAAFPAHVYVITPTMSVAVSPPRSVFDARERIAEASEHDRVGILALERVVDDDLVQVVLRLQRGRRRARRDDVRRLLEAAARRHQDLAEAPELEVLGDVERLRHADEHPLVPLGERRVRERAASRRSA